MVFRGRHQLSYHDGVIFYPARYYRAIIQIKTKKHAALLSIFIAALGLFGLAAYTAERRTKEIGIRKVMGASVSGLVSLLTREYLVLIGAAVLVAWPLAYYSMSKWLAGFVRRTTLSPLYFLAAAAAMLFVVLAAVGSRTLRAARANPADSLRYE